MHTFSIAMQTVNLDNHIVAKFDSGDDYSICRMTVWHEGGEASVLTFNRNGLLIDSVLIPPPEQTKTSSSKASADDSAPSKGSKSK